ncbi:M1 family metallopeptidase [Spirosoma sp. KUDC1026]|uniref:M1 family metallopeptidase n=1 Tax=Spirosoma sp. KUDC1026 TaxID=2745947 RepID=UPI00159BEEE9|nr:M1 family metallopeptidase [Spirosoma sp. KUDC1026]QKZ13268.1 M1 family metallopeptidase [Spirosoma sp. KUDC1026]
MTRLLMIIACLLPLAGWAQRYEFTHADTLRGSITPERAWWDLSFYHLTVRVQPTDSTLSGSTEIRYRVLKPGKTMQVDLQRPLRVVRVEQDGKPLQVRQDGDAYFVTLTKPQQVGKTEAITVQYAGKPHIAKRPPWDGGMVWSRDKSGNWFIATACQGLGASAWWPCKDHMYDEPDSMAISITVPEDLMDVSNGKLRRVTTNADHTRTFDWYVQNPINNYGVNMNIGQYEHWSETYQGEKGPLAIDYYALKDDAEQAREQYKQVPKMMKAFEYWFGPYPFYEDGYKLVQTPYLGMEHQSSVTYGNRFRNGYLGRDLSQTGWGLLWDFIIVHESGHEWFANNITYKDIADMWIHESFTNYSECLFTEYYYGKEAGAQYVVGCRALIRNDKPIIGTYNVNRSGSGDMYYKGGNMLHMIRQIVGDDDKWRQVLRGLNKTFYHQTVTTRQIENYMIEQTGKNLKPIFDQYLRTTQIPVLEYRPVAGGLQYRYTNCIADFTMPLRVCLGESGPYQQLQPTTQWKTLPTKQATKLTPDANYYVLCQAAGK